MRIPKITLNFSKLTDADFLQKAQVIVTSISSNPAFVNPVPPLADVQNALAAYAEALVAAGGLGRNAVAVKNAARVALEKLLVQLGMYVMYIANGDVAILVSSGYTLAKEPQPQQLENPGNVELSNGITSGQLNSSVKHVAKSYLHEIAEAAPETTATGWRTYATSKSNYMFTDLTPGKQYWVRVAAIGTRGQVAYSTIATQFAQ